MRKHDVAELLAFSNAEFDKEIKEMSLQDLLNTISTLQREMTKEQENFNSMSAELSSLNKNSRQYKQISKEISSSQTRLTALMDRSMKCFQQQGSQTTTTKFPNVQRRNSLKEANSVEQAGSKPVQRKLSARIPKKEGEVTPLVLVNKTSAKSTPDLVTSKNKPVFLKSLTDGNTSKIEVKKPLIASNNTSSIVKPMQTFQNGIPRDNIFTNSEQKINSNEMKKQPVRTSTTFNLQKSSSNEFLSHSSSKHENGVVKTTSDQDISKKMQFNVVLRKTNRSLIDNEEQESNFRHSVDLDLTKLPSGMDSKPLQKSAENLSNINKITKINVSSTQKSTASTSTLEKSVSGTKENAVQNVKLKSIDDKPEKSALDKNENAVQNVKLKSRNDKPEKPASSKNENAVQNVKLKSIDGNKPNIKNETEKVDVVKKQEEPQKKQVVSSSVQFRPTTAVEARAFAGGERQNLLEEIQNFKRKPSPEAEKKLAEVKPEERKSKASSGPEIVKSGIKKDTDIIDDLDISPEELHGVPLDGDDEVAPHRINLINWDPTKLLNVLYTVKLNKDTTEDVSHKFVNMEGLMEKLPMNKKKATLLKTWKRRFFRAKDGWLHYYEGLSEDGETSNRDKPSDSVQLMGGKIEDLGNRILGVDDGRGRFLMVRCPTEKEYGQWKLALESQTADNVTYVRPALSSPPHPEKKVIIIDIGSGGIRAGIMGAQPCLPQMYFPSIVARNKTTQELVIGIDAYKPEVRKNSTLLKLVEPSNKVDKDHVRPFAIDMEMMSAVFDYIFKGLKTDPGKHWIMLSTPYKLGDGATSNLMKILTDQFHTKGVCMVMQSLLALYSYNATSGIIVDVGDRMEILPIFDGVLIEGGVSRQSYGGQKVADSLNSSLVELKYNFFSPVDKLLVRYVMEQTCYVCDNYKDLKSKCDKDSIDYQTTVYLNNFDLPDDAHLSVTHDLSCFKSTEGFFNTDMWGMDYPCVHKLVYQAIQSCPMDNRKHMYRAIYLSGGVTMLPGFAERLQAELKKLAPPSVLVEVHASPQRYHSAFIGAGTLLSSVPINEQVFISSEEWKKDGAKAFKKWKGP